LGAGATLTVGTFNITVEESWTSDAVNAIFDAGTGTVEFDGTDTGHVIDSDDIFKREDAIKDVGAILDWIDEQPELNNKKIAIAGKMYGGYLTLASLIKYGKRFKAGIDLFGIRDFINHIESTSTYRKAFIREEYGDNRIPEIRKFLTSISPIKHIDKIVSPLLVVQGLNDFKTSSKDAKLMVDELLKRKQPVWALYAKNAGNEFAGSELLKAEIFFLKKYLLEK